MTIKRITVADAPLSVNAGQVELTAAQAAPRRHALKLVKDDKKGGGIFEVTAPLQFKRGEVFGFDGVIGKGGVLVEAPAAAKPQADLGLST